MRARSATSTTPSFGRLFLQTTDQRLHRSPRTSPHATSSDSVPAGQVLQLLCVPPRADRHLRRNRQPRASELVLADGMLRMIRRHEDCDGKNGGVLVPHDVTNRVKQDALTVSPSAVPDEHPLLPNAAGEAVAQKDLKEPNDLLPPWKDLAQRLKPERALPTGCDGSGARYEVARVRRTKPSGSQIHRPARGRQEPRIAIPLLRQCHPGLTAKSACSPSSPPTAAASFPTCFVPSQTLPGRVGETRCSASRDLSGAQCVPPQRFHLFHSEV